MLAIVLQAVVRIGRPRAEQPAAARVAAVAFVAIFFLRRAVPADRARGGPRRLDRGARRRRRLPAAAARAGGGRPTPSRCSATAIAASASRPCSRAARCRPCCCAVAGAGRALACWRSGRTTSSRGSAVFFSQMAVVTFGGAYAVLAYVAQAGGRDLWLADAGRDARRARPRRDDAGAADPGRAVRRLPRRLPRARRRSTRWLAAVLGAIARRPG